MKELKVMFMKANNKPQYIYFLVLIVSAFFATTVRAHLMVAQHGTLNFLDDDVFMVLSLPASAFTDADENNDGQLSLTEFSEHRTDLIALISDNVDLSNKEGSLQLHNIMVSPVTPHDAPKEPASQLIVMGRFSLDKNNKDLQFHVGLFGAKAADQTIEITANWKSRDLTRVFELSPKLDVGKLKFD